jgi:hypothetical protein
VYPSSRSFPISPPFQQWLDNNSSDNNSDFSSAGGSPPLAHINAPAALNPDDEVIPTAIVIKNIPFNVKRETLLDIIVGLPSPLLSSHPIDLLL